MLTLCRFYWRVSALLLALFCGYVFAGAGWGYLGVYTSGLLGNWVEARWEDGAPVPIAVDLAATAPGKTGKAVEVHFTNNAYDAYGFGTGDWSSPYFLNEVKTVEFDVYIEPDSMGTENLAFILGDAGQADDSKLVDYIPGWASMTDAQRFGHWFHITIDLVKLHPKIAHFGRFLFFNNAGEDSKPHYRMYDVKLGVRADTTPPVVHLDSATKNLTYDQITLAFSSDEPTTYLVEYGDSSLNQQVSDYDNWAGSHQAVLTSLSPGTQVHYRITALDHRMDPAASPNKGILEGSYTLPPKPTVPPAISDFNVSGVEGHKASLAWNTNRPCAAVLAYHKQAGGAVMTRILDDYRSARSFVLDLLEPNTAYTGTLKVKDAFGLESSQPFTIQTAASSRFDVSATINTVSHRPISPYIYGTNQHFGASQYTFGRLGGNRWTAYNWENNASSAGIDYLNENDDYLPWSLGVPQAQYGVPGKTVLQGLNKIFAANAKATAALITVPVQGYVAADLGPGGDVNLSGPDYLRMRFKQLRLAKPSAFSFKPSTSDAYVYTDEYVNWVKQKAKPAHPGKQIFYSLDNEPDLWASTHPRIALQPESYDSLCQKNGDAAKTIKRVDPKAVVFGFVSYGWYGYTTLQGAPDGSQSDYAAHGDFTEYYLNCMKQAGSQAGKRLVDVLDLHYYTEAQTPDGSQNVGGQDVSAAAVAARLQSSRSLWDASYVENSWITRDWLPSGDKAIRLIPRMQAKIKAKYPGTKLAVTEYNFGGGGHISGAIAQADALGAFGRYGVFAANRWQMADQEPFIEAAFKMYRGFDGGNANFGDVSLAALSSKTAKVAVYASLDSTAPAPGRMVIVAINRTGSFQDLALNSLPLQQGSVQVYRLAGASPKPAYAGQVGLSNASLVVALPPMSVSTFNIH